MKRETKNLCIISAISFIAGATVGPFAMMVFFELVSPNREQQAKAFFYRTMNMLFEGTYDPNEGSVSPQFMDEFKKYEPQLGKNVIWTYLTAHPAIMSVSHSSLQEMFFFLQ